MTWCVAETEPMRERVALNFLHEIVRLPVQDLYLPKIREVRHTHHNRPYKVVACLFPGYLFINNINGHIGPVRRAQAVRDLLMWGKDLCAMTRSPGCARWKDRTV